MSKAEAIAWADKYGLGWEVKQSIESGFSPEAALEEWDII